MAEYELDREYAPIDIVDAADGSGTTWPEFVEQVGKMDEQVAALTENAQTQFEYGSGILETQRGLGAEESITFAKSYSSPPSVVVTNNTGAGGNNVSNMFIQASQITATGFKVQTYLGVGAGLASINFAYSWIAVGK